MRSPPGAVLLFLVVLVVALPAARLAGLTLVGGFAMFTEPVEYRLRVTALDRGGRARAVSPRDFGSHLGRDARRVIGPSGRFMLGEASATLLAGGLEDIARLACALDERAQRVEVVLERRRGARELRLARARSDCAR